MRKAAEGIFKDHENFKSIDATAENTGLDSDSIDIITAGQAMQFFDSEKTRVEFSRIIKKEGRVALIWNIGQDKSEIMLAKEDIIMKYFIDPQKKRGRKGRTEIVGDFFKSCSFKKALFQNDIEHDIEGLKGDFLSSIYAPSAEHPNYRPMISEIENIFGKFEKNSKVTCNYTTEVYYGQLLI